MFLIVQIPAYNERQTLPSLVEKTHHILTQEKSIDRFEILIIDDGSTDDTPTLTAELSKKYKEIKQLRHSQKLGLGIVFKDGVHYARSRRADILVNMDGDGQFYPHDIPRILTPLLQNQADLVLGSRFLAPEFIPKMPKEKYWGNRAFALLISTLIGQRLHDVSCGFRAFSRQTLLQLHPKAHFTYTHESILQAAAHHQRILEVPIRVRGEREFGQSRMAHNLAKYGFQALNIIAQNQLQQLWKKIAS